MLVYGREVRPGDRDDIVVFWTDGTERHAIVDVDYTETKVILRRFPGAAGYDASLRAYYPEPQGALRYMLLSTAALGSHNCQCAAVCVRLRRRSA
jgi:hypothetical protein